MYRVVSGNKEHSEFDADTGNPITYATFNEASAERQVHLTNMKEAVTAGDMPKGRDEKERQETGIMVCTHKKVGVEEGARCNRNSCDGVIEFGPSENCSCHINPPCNSCVADRRRCPKCQWTPGDDE